MTDLEKLEKRVLELEREIEDERQRTRALQIIRSKYEIKYGVRIFANGSEQKLNEEA